MTLLVRVPTHGNPDLADDVWCGWLGSFRDWVTPTTEGANEAIFAVGSVILGLAIGRNVAVHYGRPVFPNIYANIVGTTGVPKKSTIVSRGHHLIASAFVPDSLRLSRSIGSGEGLLELFCREEKEAGTGRVVLSPIPGQRVLLDEPEFTGLLKKSRRPGTANITEILLALYDGDDYSPRTRSRPITVEQPFFSIVTTTTPDSLQMVVEDVDIDSGLLPRFATFWCTPREPIAFPPPPDEGVRLSLAHDLGELAGHAAEVGSSNGFVMLSPAAMNEWETVYAEVVAETRKAPKAAAAIMARIPLQIMKWSLVYALQGRRSQVEVDDLARGVLVGTYLIDTARLVPDMVRKAGVARIEQKIIDALTKVGGQWMRGADIHRMVSGRVKAEELRRSLASLVELGVLEETLSSTGRSSVYRVAMESPKVDEG